MFDKLKSFFGFSKKEPAQPTAAPAAAPAAPAKEDKKAAPAPASKPASAPAAKPAPAAAAAPAPAAVSNIPDENINLPLKAVLARLPASLSALVKSAGAGEIGISQRKVVSQLPQGSVKISFGELRQAAPPGTFLEVASQDQTMVELPLPDILSRINPALLTRKTPTKVLEAPAEVGNIFGERGQQLAQPQEPAAKPAPASAPAAAPIAPSAPLPAPSAPVKPSAPLPAPSLPKPAAPSAAPAPVKPSAPLPAPSLPKPAAPSAPLPAPSLPKPPAPAPVAAPKPSTPLPAPSLPKPPAPAMPAPSLPKPPAPAPIAAPVAAAAAGSETLSVTVSQVSADWPDAIKQEVKALNLGGASLVLPTSQIEAALKSGKITYPWKQLLNWAKPAPSSTSSANGDINVELPLSVIAPLFLAQHKPGKVQKKLAVGENIPDIFSGGQQVKAAPAPAPAPAAPAPAVAAPTPAPAPVAPAPAPISLPKPPAPTPVSLPKPPAPAPAPAVEKVPATLGELFGDAGKKDWSPNEIVQKTSTLKGMAGAVIATNDGLLVAGQLPAPLKPETIAAFLPQIFGRMNQYGKELQVGEMNSLTVEFQKVPWHVVKLGPLFFAAVGKAGEPLPAAHLAVITGELGKQMK